MSTTSAVLFALVASVNACAGLRKMENLVTFGDSLTDDGRAFYWQNNQVFPPPGLEVPIVPQAASGGASWGRFVANRTGANYNNYAVSGASCSREIVETMLEEVGISFPTVLDYEIPAFEADLGFTNLYPNRQADNTVYNILIGGNDLGILGYLGDSQRPGATIETFTNCVWDAFDRIYNTGGRFFVVMTEMPFELTPLYKSIENGGLENTRLFPRKADTNSTLYEQKALQSTTSANSLFEIGGPFNLLVKKRWPGATLVVFDTHQVLRDIYANPQQYFDAPADVDGVYQLCHDWEGECDTSEHPLSSFMWFDELHPSERTSEILAEHFMDAINGNSSYATYWS